MRDRFVTDLTLKAETCGYEVLTDSLIRDQIVKVIRNERPCTARSCY